MQILHSTTKYILYSPSVTPITEEQPVLSVAFMAYLNIYICVEEQAGRKIDRLIDSRNSFKGARWGGGAFVPLSQNLPPPHPPEPVSTMGRRDTLPSPCMKPCPCKRLTYLTVGDIFWICQDLR